MTGETSRPIHRRIKRIGVAAGFLFLVSAIDGFICGHLDGKNVVRALPGTRQAISGNLDQPVKKAQDIRFHFENQILVLKLVEIKGRFWRGEVSVPAAAAEGVYRLKADSAPDDNPRAGEPVCQIMVFSSRSARDASYPSLIRQHFGMAPWWITAGTAPILAICLILNFYMNGQFELELKSQGLLPIVKLARHKDHWEVAAAADLHDDFQKARLLEVVDKNRQPVAKLTVSEIKKGVITGKVDLSAPVRPDGYLRLPATAPEKDRIEL